jgi:hypothetical protein
MQEDNGASCIQWNMSEPKQNDFQFASDKLKITVPKQDKPYST